MNPLHPLGAGPRQVTNPLGRQPRTSLLGNLVPLISGTTPSQLVTTAEKRVLSLKTIGALHPPVSLSSLRPPGVVIAPRWTGVTERPPTLSRARALPEIPTRVLKLSLVALLLGRETTRMNGPCTVPTIFRAPLLSAFFR